MDVLKRRDRQKHKAIVGAIVAAIASQTGISTVGADTNPATAPMTVACRAIPSNTEIENASLPGAVPGETVRVESEARFEEGTVYQHALTRADGSTYFASFMELRSNTSAQWSPNAGTLKLERDGVPIALTPGTQPAAGAFVIDTSAPGGAARIYFPGNAAAMLADPASPPEVAFVVGATGTTFVLSQTGTVTNDPSVLNGTPIAVGHCVESTSTGSSSRSVQEQNVSVAAIEPSMTITKSSGSASASPGGLTDWEIVATVPDALSNGLHVSDANDVVIRDVIPNELSPADDAGNAIADGGTLPSGGMWTASDRTIRWSFASVAHGTQKAVRYKLRVADTLDPSVGTVLRNSADVAFASLPPASPSRRTYSAGPASAEVAVGLAAPEIDKSVSPTVTGLGGALTYTVTAKIPPNAAMVYSASVIDVMPDGLIFDSYGSITCTSGCSGADPTPTSLTVSVNGAGVTTLGYSLGNLPSSVDQRSYEMTYQAHISPTRTTAAGTQLAYGQSLVNHVLVGYDAEDRLAGILPNLAAAPTFEVSATADASVNIAKPQLTISKTAVSNPNPWDPSGEIQWEIAITNISEVDAYQVAVQDDLLGPELGPTSTYWSPDASVTAPGGGFTPRFVVDHIAANQTVHIEVMTNFGPRLQDGAAVPRTNRALITQMQDSAGNVIVTTPGSPDAIAPATASITPLVPLLTIDKSAAPTVAMNGIATYTITLANIGLATANNVTILDAFGGSAATTNWNIQWWTASNGASGWGSPSNGGFNVPPIGPGQSFTFTYTAQAPSTTRVADTNTALVKWTDNTNHSTYTNCLSFLCTVKKFEASDSATVAVLEPHVSIHKEPKENSFVPAGGTVVFRVDVVNDSGVALHNVKVTDMMPPTLTYESHSETDSGPAFVSSLDSGDEANPVWTIAEMQPGSSMTLFITARQDGSVPSDFTLVNSASVVSDEIPTAQVDRGETEFVPDLIRPTVEKSVAPASARPGDLVTWTVQFTEPDNLVSVYDQAVIDKLPDGLEFVSYGGVTCIGGACPAVSTLPASTPSMTPPITGDRSSSIGWWLGDIAPNTPFVLEFTYVTRIEAALDNGLPVLQGQAGEPFTNRVRGYYNTSDSYADALSIGSAPTAPNTYWNGRTQIAAAQVGVVTPNVTIDKTITDHPIWNYLDVGNGEHTAYAASAGDTITYKLRVCNIGSATAYEVALQDDMALGNLRNIAISTPPGFTLTDGWSLADPTAHWSIASLGAGACADIVYTGTPKPSADLLPGLSAVNSDFALIHNSAIVSEFHSAGTGVPGDQTFGPQLPRATDLVVMTPFVFATTECISIPAGGTAQGTANLITFATSEVTWSAKDSEGLDAAIGGLHDAVIELSVPPAIAYVPGSARIAGSLAESAGQVGYRDPDVITTHPDGGTTLRWNEAYIPYPKLAYGPSSAMVYVTLKNTAATDSDKTALSVHAQGVDASGATGRGANVDAQYDYTNDHGSCGRSPHISKHPKPGYPYYDAWRVNPDENFDYWGTWWGADETSPTGTAVFSTNAVVTDTMPDGPTGYVPGSATFTMRLLDGSTQSITAADITETITPISGGRTRITWTDWPVEADSVDFRIPNLHVPLARTDLYSRTITNDVRIYDPTYWQGVESACGSPNANVCSSAPIFVRAPQNIAITKTVDDSAPHAWGTTRTWTVRVTLPAGTTWNDLTIVDQFRNQPVPGQSQLDFTNTASTVSATCSGCDAGDPSPISLPYVSDSAGGHAIGWFLGAHLSAITNAREYTIVYTTTSPTLADLGTSFTDVPENALLPRVNEVVGVSTVAPVAPSFEPPALGASWFDGFGSTYAGTICSSGTGCNVSDGVQATIQLGFPQLELSKTCRALNGKTYAYTQFGAWSPPLERTQAAPGQSLPGQPNVVCDVTVRNTGGAPASHFSLRDVPRPTGKTEDDPNQWGDPMYDYAMNWDVISESGPLPATLSWADSGGTEIRWDAGSGDPIDVGDSWKFSLAIRADGWDFDESQFHRGYGVNDAVLSSWQDDFGTTLGAETTRSTVMEFAAPAIDVIKGGKAPAWSATSTWSNVDKFWNLATAWWRLDQKNQAYVVGGQGTWDLVARITNTDSFQTINVADHLPASLDYVPGSARLVRLKSVDPSFATDPVFEEIPLPDPTVTPMPTGTNRCYFASGVTNPPTGDLLTWNFSRGSTGTGRAPWDSTLLYLTPQRASDLGYANWAEANPNDTLYIRFDTKAPADLIAQCTAPPNPPFPTVNFLAFRNTVDVEGSTVVGRTVAAQAEKNGTVSDPVGLRKSPDNGVVASGSTAWYTIDAWDNHDFALAQSAFVQACFDPSNCFWINGVEWFPPVASSSTPYPPEYFPPADITDVFTDYGLWDTTTEPVQLSVTTPAMLGGPDTPMVLGVDYTQTVTRIDANHVQFTWHVFHMPFLMARLSLADFSYVPGYSYVRIKLPLDIPPATAPNALADGTLLPNTATIHRGVAAANSDQSVYFPADGVTGAPDDALYRVVTPSPAPTPVKTATPHEAVGGLIDYEVKVTLPANQVWLDLGYTDVLPAGVTYDSSSATTCVTASAAACDTLPIQTYAPAASAGGRTNLGWYFGDVPSASEDRVVTMRLRGRLVEDTANGAPLNPGDRVTNTVTGYANLENRIDDATPPARPLSAGDFMASATAETLVVQPSLTITKVADQAGPLLADDAISWTVTVTNTGDGTAYGTVVRDTPNAAVASVVPTGPSASFASKGWTADRPWMEWTIPSIAPGDHVTLTYAGAIAHDAIDKGFVAAHNTADVVSYLTQLRGTPHLRSLEGPEAPAVVPLATVHLEITKVTGPCGGAADTETIVGKPLTFCVQIHNAGTEDARGVELTDRLPVHWTFDSGSGVPTQPDSVTTDDPSVMVWTIGAVVAGETMSVEYSATPMPGAAPAATNTAYVTSLLPSDERAVLGTEGYTARTSSNARILNAGLEISKLPLTQTHPFLPQGGPVPFTIQVGANFDTDLNGTVVTDTLPAPLVYTAGTATSDCSGFAEVSVGAGPGTSTQIRWKVDLPAQTHCLITVPTTHPGGRIDAHRVLNKVEAENALVPLVAAQAVADFYAYAALGDRVWYDTNDNGIQDVGEAGVPNVAVDLLDQAGVVLRSTATSSDGVYLFEQLVPGTYMVRFRGLPPGYVFGARTAGSDPTKDSDADIVSGITQSVVLHSGDRYLDLDAGIVEPTVNLELTKTAVEHTVTTSGGTVTWSLVVKNRGPGVAKGPLTIDDPLAEGMTYVSAGGDPGWSCAPQGAAVHCVNNASLGNGSASTLTIHTAISAGLAKTGSITNSATVKSPSSETVLGDNSSRATVEVSTDAARPTAPGGRLPVTGSEIGWLAACGGALFAAGVLIMGRRRRRHGALA